MFSAKRLKAMFLVGAAIAILSMASVTQAYLTDAGSYLPLAYFTFVPPAAGGSYVDSNFGTSIKRLSNAMGTRSDITSGNLTQITNEYSTMSPFNNDNTHLILQHDSYFGLYDASGNFQAVLPFVINAGAEPRWSRTDPNVLYFINNNQLKQYNVATQVQSIVHTFSEYTVISGKGESDISVDGNHFALVGDSQSVFIYEISTDRKSPVFNTQGRGFDSLYITPNNNVTITWFVSGSARYNGIEMFDGNMNFLRQVARAGGHMDVARDINGDEVLLWANSADPQPVCNNGIVKIRLADASQTCLISLDWSLAVHVSAPDNNGWVFVETYAPSDPSPLAGWPRYTDEILQVKLDGSETRRIAHHRSRPFDSYYYTPRTATSHDGSRIVFSSNFGLQQLLGYPSIYVDTYMIVLDASAPAPAPAPAPEPAPAPAPAPAPVPAISRFEQNDASIALTGDWVPNSLSLHSGGSAVLSMTGGSRATFTFNGTGANWIAYKDEWAGIARVYLDGALLGQVDTYSSPNVAQATAYSVTGLVYGTHTLAVEATGTRNASSGGSWVWVDAFEVVNDSPAPAPAPAPEPAPAPAPAPAPTPTTIRLEESDPSVTFQGTWTPNGLAVHSSGSAVLSMNRGSRATLRFTGTAVSWIGYRDEWSGIARVIIDGRVIASVDTYMTPARAQAATYSINNLAPGSHTLTIEVTGKKNKSSAGFWVWVDAFDVTN